MPEVKTKAPQGAAKQEPPKKVPYRPSGDFLKAYKAAASVAATREPEEIRADLDLQKTRMRKSVQVVVDLTKANDPRGVNRRPFLGGIPADPMAAAGTLRSTCENAAKDWEAFNALARELENELKIAESWRR